jgi:hypothetical protein
MTRYSRETIGYADSGQGGGKREVPFEELQAEIRLRTGRKVTQQELLTRRIDSFRESTVPLSEDEKEKMRRGRFASGVETEEEDIDDILYG